jgi:hypothetical protein
LSVRTTTPSLNGVIRRTFDIIKNQEYKKNTKTFYSFWRFTYIAPPSLWEGGSGCIDREEYIQKGNDFSYIALRCDGCTGFSVSVFFQISLPYIL